jgi:hypothetical protein
MLAPHPLGFVVFAVTVWLAVSAAAHAQQLDPRAYLASPVGAGFAVFGVTGSRGDVLIDPSLPVDDVDVDSGVITMGLGRTFSLLGRQAVLFGALPLARTNATGNVGDGLESVTRVGLGDPTVRLSVHLVGNRAMSPAEFVKTPSRTIVGVSLKIAMPLGQYDQRT